MADPYAAMADPITASDPYAAMADPITASDPYAAMADPITPASAPATDQDYIAGLRKAMTPNPKTGKVDRAAVNAYAAANHQALSVTNPSFDYIDHGGNPNDIAIHQNPAQQAQQAQTMMNAPDSAAGSGIRGFTQGLVGGVGDKMGAAIDTVIPTEGGQTIWGGHSFGDSYAHNKQFEFAQSEADNNAHPYAYNGGQIAGAIASPLGKIGAGFKVAEGAGLLARSVPALLPAAVYSGIYGAGQSQADTYGGEAWDAAKGLGEGVAGGVVGAGLTRGAGAIATGVSDTGKQLLARAGVQFTPGQALGGTAANIERKLGSLPFTGSQINARLADGEQQWQNATYNRALEPYGTQIPAGTAGPQAMAQGQEAVKNTFDRARSGLQVAKSPEFDAGISALQDRAVNGGVDALSPQYQNNLAGVIKNNVLNKFNEDGVMSAQDYTQAASNIRRSGSKFASGQNDADKQAYGASLKELADHLDTAALSNPASNPEAVALLQKARAAYPEWKLVTGAANRGGADGAGQFSPSQYLQQVKKNDPTMDKGRYNSGNALGQQWGQQGVDALGKSLPNSFSADRYLAGKMVTEGLPAAAAGLFHAGPAVAAASLAPLAADIGGAAAYSKPVNSFANKLMFGARPQIVSKIGQGLNDFAPKAALAGAGATLAIQHAAQ